MYKNQLQELAQRSCFNLPSYTCIREGPDHAPRFKATVTFNGEVFESPGYHTTLRQAEHAAAEVALNTLSRRGPTPALASRILDETGVCKNLLQETAQRAGVSLPVYTTIRSGPKHQPLFKCVVEVGRRNFVGEPAKTKKQAEKNAALAAWSELKQITPGASQVPSLPESREVLPLSAFSQYMQDEKVHAQKVASMGTYSRARVRSVNVRDMNSSRRTGITPSGKIYPAVSLSVHGGEVGSYEPSQDTYFVNQQKISTQGEAGYEGQRYLCKQPSRMGPCWPNSAESFAQRSCGRVCYHTQATPGSYRSSSRRQGGQHQRRHSLSGIESPMLSHEAMAVSRVSGGGNMLGRFVPHQQHIRGLPYQSLSERFDLNRPSLLEELQLRDDEEEWYQKEDAHPHDLVARCKPWQSQSDRFESRCHRLPQVEEVQARDEEDWLHDDSVDTCRTRNFENIDRNPVFKKEGWLRGETLIQNLQEQKSHGGYRAGWLQEEILKHTSAEERRHGVRAGWLQGEASKLNFEQRGGSSCQHVAHEEIGWPHTEIRGERSYSYGASLVEGFENERNYEHGDALCIETQTRGVKRYGHGASLGGLKNERSYGHGDAYKDLQGEKSVLFPTPKQVTSSSSSTASPFSSLWSKSTQWWGAHMPSSTLSLRSPSSLAPAVRVRQMVPAYSAPPPRPANTPTPHRPSTNSAIPSMEDAEASVHQVFNSLRL